jgi:hypothetical protein
MFSFRHLPFLLLSATAAFAVGTEVSTAKPIINFSLPSFTPEGYREWLIRGSQAFYIGPDQINIRELTLSIFSGQANDKVQTMILSPDATVHPAEGVVSGPTTIRVLNDDIEASGANWQYFQKDKRVTIARDVHVIFQAELKDFLQ